MTSAVGVLGSTASARGAVAGQVAMYSDSGDYIGQGVQQIFTASNSSFTLDGNPGEATVNISSTGGQQWTLNFAAPDGQTLAPGYYDKAGRAGFQGGTAPGIDIYGDGRGCNTDFGRFEIKDIAFSASGVPTRLWLVYEQHCEAGPAALFGEVRLGEPPTTQAVSSSPEEVRWPANDFGTPETVVPVRFGASVPTSVTNVTLGGADPSDFTIRQDGCSGQVLAAGDDCQVQVRSTPTAPGLRTATLVLGDAAGHTYSVPLQSWTYGGTTRLVMNSDPGDWVGNGQDWSFVPSQATIDAVGTPEQVYFSIDGGDWTGQFNPGQGDILTAGTTYTGAARASFRGTSPGLEVTGDGRGCNTITGQFTVTAATFDDNGQLKTFGARFDQHCEGATPALHGEFDWRVGDNTPPAPWMQETPAASGGGSSTSTTSTPSTPSTTSTTSTTSSPSSTATPSMSPTTAPSSGVSLAGSGTATSPTNGGQSPAAAALAMLTRTGGSVRVDAARATKAVTILRHQSASRHARGLAASALIRLHGALNALQRGLARYRPTTARGRRLWDQLQSDLRAWAAALSSEQRALQSRAGLSRQTWQLDARARARQAIALRQLGWAAQMIRAG